MKTYLVTGASRGLGMAVSKLLLERGNAVHGTYNTGKQVADDMTNAHDNLQMHQIDLASHDEIKNLANSLSSVTFDGIVNSAGIFIDLEFDNFNFEEFEKTFRVNAFAPLYLVHALRKNLVPKSSIVNVSASDSETGAVSGVAYSASKAAVESLTKSLTLLLEEDKIRSNAVAIGWMGDGMQAPQELLDIVAEFSPSGRIASYEEIAETVLFLLSDKASYVNGAILPVDGGDMTKSYVLDQESKIYSE